MSNLTINSKHLNRAVRSLYESGDNDLFPYPFEFRVINHNKKETVGYLSKQSVGAYEWGESRNLLIPRDNFVLRNATELDPLDSIFFTALIRQISPKIKSSRKKFEERSVFSHIIVDSGKLYENKYDDFWLKSVDLVRKRPFVLVTDITDFYNQIDHHTLENQLEKCGIELEVIKSLNNLFDTQNSKSKGIPIGPQGSHILAELSLLPLDEYLSDSGFVYCRFFDDIHIFCDSYEDGLEAHNRLATYLDREQKLLLSKSKTDIYNRNDFIRKSMIKMRNNPKSKNEERILEITKNCTGGPYEQLKIERLSKSDKDGLSKENIEFALKSYRAGENIDYGDLRFFLRRLRQTGSPGGIEYIIYNLQFFMPVLIEAFRYIFSASGNYSGTWQEIGEILGNLICKGYIRSNDYLLEVAINLFSHIKELNNIEKILAHYNSSSAMIKREVLLVAKLARSASFISFQKNNYSSMTPWEKRAMIYSSEVLASDERKYWLRKIRESSKTTYLEKLIIKEVTNN